MKKPNHPVYESKSHNGHKIYTQIVYSETTAGSKGKFLPLYKKKENSSKEK